MLPELYDADEVKITPVNIPAKRKKVKCEKCDGSGDVNWFNGEFSVCQDCNGKGYVKTKVGE